MPAEVNSQVKFRLCLKVTELHLSYLYYCGVFGCVTLLILRYVGNIGTIYCPSLVHLYTLQSSLCNYTTSTIFSGGHAKTLVFGFRFSAELYYQGVLSSRLEVTSCQGTISRVRRSVAPETLVTGSGNVFHLIRCHSTAVRCYRFVTVAVAQRWPWNSTLHYYYYTYYCYV
jgi:hypothetical protein